MLATAAAALAALVAPALAATFSVSIGPGLKYSTPDLAVVVGDTVTWTFAAASHTVTQVTDATTCTNLTVGGFDSKALLAPNTFSQTFTKPGNFWYICTVAGHCTAGMRGVVRVSAAGAATSSATAQPTNAAPAAATTHTVATVGLAFSKPDLTIALGETVVWSFGPSPHTVTQVNDKTTCTDRTVGGFDSKNLVAPNTFSQTFTKPGVFWYICTVGNHCASGMRGVVRVTNTTTPVPENAGATGSSKGSGNAAAAPSAGSLAAVLAAAVVSMVLV
ncbi:hypothetical protein HK105_208015 [Polyrhizophydium stewartii]|uniref:Phytocyanin domain-containing protein n=1 Tax=Polyrhizophydium stewartii TaxID=2732419 RepID=A0ABR4MZB6_9FUNG